MSFLSQNFLLVFASKVLFLQALIIYLAGLVTTLLNKQMAVLFPLRSAALFKSSPYKAAGVLGFKSELSCP